MKLNPPRAQTLPLASIILVCLAPFAPFPCLTWPLGRRQWEEGLEAFALLTWLPSSLPCRPFALPCRKEGCLPRQQLPS